MSEFVREEEFDFQALEDATSRDFISKVFFYMNTLKKENVREVKIYSNFFAKNDVSVILVNGNSTIVAEYRYGDITHVVLSRSEIELISQQLDK